MTHHLRRRGGQRPTKLATGAFFDTSRGLAATTARPAGDVNDDHGDDRHWTAVQGAPTAARLLTRALAIAALVGIALVHLVQLPDTTQQAPGLGALFAALTLATALLAAALLHRDDPWLWRVGGLTAAAAIGGYLLTRSVAVPFDDGDVGNWGEPLGLVALFIETSLIGLCGYRLAVLSDASLMENSRADASARSTTALGRRG